jgi:hypothetical protein
MAELEQGIELRFVATQNVDLEDPRIRRALTILGGLGLEPQFDMPAMTLLTIEGLAEQTPVTGLDSYVGQEHFKVFAQEADVPSHIISRGFSKLVMPYLPERTGRNPYTRPHERNIKQNAEIRDLYKTIGIQVVRRADVDMPAIPARLGRSHYRNYADKLAITAGSVLLARDHIHDLTRVVSGIGGKVADGLMAVADTIEAKLS